MILNLNTLDNIFMILNFLLYGTGHDSMLARRVTTGFYNFMLKCFLAFGFLFHNFNVLWNGFIMCV